MDAMSSDACPVRMLSEGEYGVHSSSEGQTLFLLFFLHVFLLWLGTLASLMRGVG